MDALLSTLGQTLDRLIQQEVGLIISVDGEMKRLSGILTTVEAVLADAENKQFDSLSVRDWLCKLNELAYELEDLLDECATHANILKAKSPRQMLKKALFRLNVGRRMKDMANKLDDVAAQRQKFHLRIMPSLDWQMDGMAARRHETGSALNEDHCIYGRDDEKEEIVDILVNRVKNCQQVSVLPIVGIGGLGKTTLAQLVCKDERVVGHFETKLWVCANTFDLRILLKAAIESITGGTSNLVHTDALQQRLWELLKHRRYLLILDDVWNEDPEKWDELRNALACGSPGSSIIVTTRLKKVADIMGSLQIHYLKELSEEHCWFLFKQRAFGHVNDKYPNLEAIGREIVKKSAGVPLAAKTLGGLLRFKRKEKEWAHANECELWTLPQEESSILPALRLSFLHLPITLRRCFGYCALFPKDCRISKRNLIFLWMAHGCLPSNGKQDEEEMGDQVLDELILRSLLENHESLLGTTITMHDLVRDLAQSIMENKVPGEQQENTRAGASNCRIRHLVIDDSIEDSMPQPTSIQQAMSSTPDISSFSRLRSLVVSSLSIAHLPRGIGKLMHLRSLNLAYSSVCALPDAICQLQNLKILDLTCCFKLHRLPKHMRYLNSLRHLILEDCPLSKMPPKIRELTSLKTLSLFIVGDKLDNQLGELECLNLGGRLEIQHLEGVRSYADAKKANLSKKPNLRDLVLCWERYTASKEQEERVLKALQPHPNIETLEICGYSGMQFPSWIRNLTNVTTITLFNCPKLLFLPLGDLPRLRCLTLSWFDYLAYVLEDGVTGGNSGKTKFSSLRNLKLLYMLNLKGLSKDEPGEIFPNLKSLEINCCPSLILPPLSSVELLQAKSCSSMTLSSISKLDSLTTLILDLDEDMQTCIPKETFENLSHLVELHIHNVHKHCLPVEGLQRLKSLIDLRIFGKAPMTCLPEGWFGHLTTLQKLFISSFPELTELPEDIKCLHHLKDLTLENLQKMVTLPEALRHVPWLEGLTLDFLPQLTSLPDWLGNFTSLNLTIMKCARISSFPSTIQEMTSLQRLAIFSCPELERRYERGKGEDWNKIAHIPAVKFC